MSLAVMWVLYYLLPVRPTWFILSVCGALAHNVGQLLGAGAVSYTHLDVYKRQKQGAAASLFMKILHKRQKNLLLELLMYQICAILLDVSP